MNWQDKIKAFLHDPPDKALMLFHKSHKAKRDEILHFIGLNYDRKLDVADHIASAMQRLDIPKRYRMDDAGSCNRHICFKGSFKPVFKHTLSGEELNFKEINDFIAVNGYEKALEKYGFNVREIEYFIDKTDWKRTYFMIWRFLPEKYPLGYFLPADTRIPDHNIYDHLDVTSAISSCLGNLGLFAAKIPAVQEFISHSRKLADLWASSHIYSVLIFEGIKAIVDELGPDNVIFPHLRGNPLFDLSYGFNEVNRIKERIRIANLPNTFLCFIPLNKADYFARKVETAIKDEWMKLSNTVKAWLRKRLILFDEDLWNKQVKETIFVAKGWVEFLNFDSYNKIKEDIPLDLRKTEDLWLEYIEDPEKRTNCGHFYLPSYELLGMILTQNSRLWVAWEEEPLTGKKCLMCGLRNAIIERRMGRNGKSKLYSWTKVGWKEQRDIGRAIIKEGERLCAVCLIKRLYGRVFEEIYKIKAPRFDSVVEIAGKRFIEKLRPEDFQLLKKVDVELIYEHEWGSEEKQKTTIEELKRILKENRNDLKGFKRKLEDLWNIEKPNKYYSILMMDGDRIGKMLSGEKLPIFKEFLHPAFENRIKEYDKGRRLMGTKRILHPSLHIAISRAMKDYSIYKVPEVVKENDGFLIYSGGDDVFALFPTDKVLRAAKELQNYFRKDFYEININGTKRKVMGLGKYASMSAGIVFAHYKYPLYDAIEKVREAERSAKDRYGRCAFCMKLIRRSGEILTAGGKWDFVDDLNSVVEAIIQGKISHRFIYDLMDTLRILTGDMAKAEIKRILGRRKTEKSSSGEISEIHGKMACLVDKYEANKLPPRDIGVALKILYDAYVGEVE